MTHDILQLDWALALIPHMRKHLEALFEYFQDDNGWVQYVLSFIVSTCPAFVELQDELDRTVHTALVYCFESVGSLHPLPHVC